MAILAQDTFNRANTAASTSITSGWGTSSDGNTWSLTGGATPNFQIVSDQGEISNTNTNVFCLLSSTSYADSEDLIRVSTSSLAATNKQGVLLRYSSGANSYRCYVSGGTTLQITKGSTSLGTFSFTYAANTEYWIRFRAKGTTLTAKIWADGTAEPGAWQITVTDSSLATGQVGIYSSPDVLATTAVFDNFSVNDTTAPTALTLYGSNVAATSITTAGQLATTTGGTDISVTTKVGTATGYSEIPALGAAGAWSAAGSIGSPSGLGWLFDSPALHLQQLIMGTWTPIIKCRITSATATADMHVRAYAYDTSNGTYTHIGSLALAGQSLTTTQTVYTFAGGILGAFTFNATQLLYIDVWFDVTANTNTSATAQISLKLSTSASQGVANDMQVTTPGYQAASIAPVLANSSSTLSFSASVGGASPASQNDTLSEINGAGTAWTSSIAYSSGSGWLGISPTFGTLAALGTQVVAYTCTTGSLAAGTYTATVTFTATTGGSQAAVVVTFNVGGSSTALTAYLANAASAIQSNANQLYTLAGTPTTTTRDIVVGTALHFGELTSQGTTSSTVDSPYGAVYYFGGHPGGTVNKLSQKFIDLMVGGNGEAGLVPGGPIWGRPQIRWELIETSPGVYDWSVADDMVARCNAANILVNFNIMIPPDWRLDTDVNGNHLSTPGSANGGVYASGAATAAYATALAQRYNGASGHGTVQAFQWNEDWDTPGNNTQRDAASQWFVENWQIVGPIFRQYAPNAKLVGPASRSTTTGLAHRTTWFTHIFTYQPAGRSWAGAVVDSHGNVILDAGDFHYYRSSATDLNGTIDPDPANTIYFKDGTINVPTPAQIITNFKSVAASHGYPNFDVWCTEFGWNVYDDPVKPNPIVTPAEQSKYIQEVYDQFRLNGGSHAQVWTINPGAVLDKTVNPPTTIEPKSITFNEKTSGGLTFTKLQAYTDLQNTYIPNFPSWGGSGNTWDGALSIDAQSGFGWLLDPTTPEGQQFLAGAWSATINLKATSGGGASGTLGVDLYLRASKYNSSSGAYTTIVVTSLMGQTVNSTGAAYTLTGTGIQESFAVGEKLYIDIWPNITSNANNDPNQAIRIQKLSLDTSGHTGDPGAEVVTPGYQSTVNAASVLATSPASLSFVATAGGSNPASQNDTLSEANDVGTTWTSAITYNSGSGWLALSPDHGTLAANGTQTIAFSCTTGTLVAGTYTATVTFTAATGGAQATVNVTFTVYAVAATLTAAPATRSFRATVAGANPASQNTTLANTGGTPSAWTSSIAYGSGSGWLAISPSSSSLLDVSATQIITLSCATGSLTASTYSATVTFTATTGGATATVAVTFVVATALVGPFTITIAGNQVAFDEDTFQLQLKLDERWRCQFTVLDYAGTQQFSYRQHVVVTDAVLGIRFRGFVADVKQDKSNTYPNVAIEHQIDCIDNRALADKRTSNWLYANQYAGVIAVHQVQKYLSAENVTAAAALRWDELLSDWQVGTLAGTVATTNAYDSNPGDGDLELAAAGTSVPFLQETQDDFTTNTVGAGLTSPASGGLTFTPTQAIALKANMTVPGAGNAYIYVKVWSGAYTIASGDILSYDVWIPDSCPANNQMAGVDFVCSDGTTFRDSTGVNGVDLQGIGMHPNNDLTGLATNTWYSRRFFIDGGSTWVGKTIQYMSVAFEGDQTGNYAAYFRNITISNGGTTKATIFSATATATQTAPQQISSNGYSALSCAAITTYERHGFLFSPLFPLTAAGIARSSFVNWQFTPPIDPATGSASTKFTFTITASVDDNWTFQPCTQNGPIPGLLPGMNLSGIQLGFVYVMDNAGNDPTLTPLLEYVEGNVQPSYVCSKTDVVKTKNTQTQWNNGTLTNLISTSLPSLQLNGYARNYDDANYSNQTQYGTGVAQGVLNKVFFLTCGAGTDAKSRCDFAGSTWQNFTMECDVYVSSAFNIGLNYRTTNWVAGNNTYAYLVDLSTTNIFLSKGSNAGSSGSNTLISSHALTLSSGNWHRLKLVINGNSHIAYLDDVQYINVSDSSFTGAGYVGMHIYNPTGSPVTGNFDNFGIVAALSGTWVSQALDIHTAGTLSNSEVAIQIDPATNLTLCSFLVEVSLNNGTSWTACANQATTPGYYYTSPVPGLLAGTNASGMTQVLLRLTISSTTASTGASMPDLTAVTLAVLGAYSSSGTRISPALSLSAVGRAGTALVNYNANLPMNTGLTVATSIDNGATYQSLVNPGDPIPGITVQPLPWVDTFDVDSSANYLGTFIGQQNYASVILANTPIRYCRLDESSGTVAHDLGSQAQNGTLHGGITLNQPGLINGDSNTAMLFNGTSGYISLPTTGLPTGASPWSMECRVKFPTVPGAGHYPVALNLGNGANGQNVALYFNGDSQQFSLGFQGLTDIFSSVPVVANHIYYLAGTYNGTTGTFYCYDATAGIADITSHAETLSLTYGSATIGTDATLALWFSGVVDEPAIYNYRLTPVQVATDYDAGQQLKFGPLGPSGDWKLAWHDEFDGGSLDSSKWNGGWFNGPSSPGVGVNAISDAINPSLVENYFGPSSIVFPGDGAVHLRLQAGVDNGGSYHGKTIESGIITTAGLMNLNPASVPVQTTGPDLRPYTINGPVVLEFRARVPGPNASASGYWPGVFLTNAGNYGGISPNGTQWPGGENYLEEIDLIEWFGSGSLGSGSAFNLHAASSYAGGGIPASLLSTDLSLAYHTYTYQFTSTTVTIWIDGILVANVTPTAAQMAAQWADPQYLLIDFQAFAGATQPTTATSTPSDFMIDYVRVFQDHWTWDTANSRLVTTQTTSTNDVLEYTATSYADNNVYVDLNYSDSGGPVARMVDANNCYLLSVRDNRASASPNTVALYKVVAGTATQISSAAIAFQRGMLHRFTLDVQGTALVALMDGAQVLSVTDSAITAAGLTGILAGMANGHQIQCYSFRSQPYGDNVSAKTLRTKLTLTSTDPTATPQVLDIQAFVSSPAIGAGTLIPSASYTYTFVDKNIDDLGKQSNYGWFIDQFRAFNFQERQAVPSPWILSSNTLALPSDLEADSNLLVETAGDLYRNHQVLTGVIGTDTFAASFFGDQKTTSFTLGYPIALNTIPAITLNGQAQTVGLKGTTGYQWYYTVGSPTLTQDSTGAILDDEDVLEVAYTGTFPTTVIVDNTAAQAALALVEGGSGIVEAVEDVSKLNMSYDAAVTYANQLLIRYCITGRTLTYKTYRNGLWVGQIQTVWIPEEFLADIQLLIREIDVTIQTQPGGVVLYNYIVQATELPNVGSWQKLLASGLLD